MCDSVDGSSREGEEKTRGIADIGGSEGDCYFKVM